ncbi:MAG TPA: ABC transporter substrate-binding protein [Thermoanaerobaculia bacterium]|jgi:NitT/TauT family transport system substrate-binding protein|nr:ABC transporter substrate-binding protein [Thermoanaerobaculia bacterium]
MRGLSAVALLLFLACNREQPLAPNAPKPLTKVRVNLNPTITYAPFMIAYDEGFFTQEGIEAELVRVDSNSALVALSTGELDVMSGPIRSGLFNIMLRKAPVRIVADKGQLRPTPGCVLEAFAAPKKIYDRIQAKGGSVRGERFALIRGGFTEFMIDKFLAQQKLTRKDVEFLQISPGDATASAKRQIEAIRYFQEPNLSNGLSKGLYQVVAAAENVSPGQQHGVMMYGKRLLHGDPELGHRFMRAYLRGVRRYSEGKTKRNVEIITRHTKLPVEIIERSCWLPVANDGQVDMASMNALLDWSKTQGYLDGDVPLETWWDPRFIDAANKSLSR